MSKRIAIICNYQLLESRVGGMDYFFWAFNSACQEKQIKVDWFFPNSTNYGDYNTFNIIPQSKDMSLEQSVLNYIKHNDIQYSHIITHFVELCTSFYKSLKAIQDSKVIVVDHNPRPLIGYSLTKRIKKRIKGFLYSKHIDVFVAVSSHTKQALLNDFGAHIKNRVVLILNGLNAKKYLQKTNFTSHNKFIIASHLRKEKGIQDLILAAKDLKNHHFTIDIFGEGNYQDVLKNRVEEYGLQNKICFKGSVSNLHARYSEYDYLIHPSHGETFAYAVLESLMSHLPVITTREQGNVLGLVEENTNGFLFEVGQINELSNLLTNIITGNKRIIKHTSTFIESHFLTETMVNNYMTLIEN